MTIFETEKKPLTFLLDQIENRELALPDFQRSFVWDPNATRELVVSIISSFPAGSLLIMQGGTTVFAPRSFEESPDLISDPPYLVLDGQQRLTSLYQAFFGKGSHRYFLNIQELLEGLELDEAVEVYTVKRLGTWQTIEGQARALVLPLERIRTFNDWRDEVLELREEAGEDVKKLKTRLNELEREFIRPVELYQFPVTTLGPSTNPEAICTIFETLNRTGVKLSVFELLTARAFAHDVRLRKMWDEARAEFPILADFDIDPYYILQVIAVRTRGNPKRGTVLSLDMQEIVENWATAVGGMSNALEMLRDECGVLTSKWLPYQTMIITAAAVWPAISEVNGPAVGERRAKLQRWFWCSSFSGSYENSPNFRTEQDSPALVEWLRGGATPSFVKDFTFESERWRDVSFRQRALYRASIALLMRHSPRDFHDGVPLSKPIIDGRAVDDHHIFPRRFLKDLGREREVDSVLNHTLIDKKTNIRIGGRAPSEYLAEMRDALGDSLLSSILSSHGLPEDAAGPLIRNDFDSFLDWRLEYLTTELRTVTQGDTDETSEPEFLDDEDIQQEGAEAEEDRELPILSRDVVEFVRLRAVDEEGAETAENFLREVASWRGTQAEVGTSVRTEDGKTNYVMVRRVPSRYGAFLYFFPKLLKATLRLMADDVNPDALKFAEMRNVRSANRYQVRIKVKSPEALSEAIQLARQAYERVE